MSTFCLKMIAIIAMLIDHTAATLLTNSELYVVMRGIGRIAYPIFAFLLVEGYFHTRNVYKYIGRLAIFAVLSEIPFNLAFFHTIWYPEHQNIFITLTLGLIVVHLITLVVQHFGHQDIRSLLLVVVVMLVGFTLASFFRCDYAAGGILMILLFYFFRGQKVIQTIGLLLINWYLYSSTIQIFAVAAMLFIWFYNGKKGRSMKYFFYTFYPVHLLILYLIESRI